MNVLVTGGTGFVGRHLVAQLQRLGWNVIRLGRSAESEWKADIIDEKGLQSFAGQKKFDAVVHLAALLPGQGSEETMWQVNVEGTRNILRYFVEASTHIVFLSTGLVYGKECKNVEESAVLLPSQPYARSKLAAENVVLEHQVFTGCKATILRPSVIYGEDAPPSMFIRSLIEALRAGVSFPMTAGEQERDFLHVEDACAAMSLILQNQLEGIYNLASEEVHQIVEVARAVAGLSGHPDLLKIGELPYRDEESFFYSLNTAKIRSLLPWKPSWSLARFLAMQFI
jgi:nucleoside-diphosphate-sugar epimerase